jgi:hypothetical protein
LKRALAPGLGAIRLAVAAATIFAVAYVLSWQILYSGPLGNDALFHLHLAQWVDSSFPSLDWWYRWDDHGIGYREGYPLAAYWLAAAVARVGSIVASQGIQVVEFLISPLGAMGIYVFCAWRLHRPLAGLIAGVAYLLSTFTWTFLVDWGFYTNQAGTVLFMPAVIALDVFFEEWSAGRRGWRYRLAAVATMGLVALMGLISPFQLGAAVAVVFMYAFAIRRGGVGSRARWLLMAAPLLVGGTFLLTAFWSLPQQEYLSFVASRVPPRAYDPALFQVWGLDQIFGLHPLRPTVLSDRMTISPAVWIPALAGVAAAVWNARARVLTGLVLFGVLTMVTTALDGLTWGIPVLSFLVHARAGVTLVQFCVPILAGIGVVEAPAMLGVAIATLGRMGERSRVRIATGLVAGALVLEIVGIGQFAHWVSGKPNAMAYGDFEADTNDIWSLYPYGAAPTTDLGAQLLDEAAWRPLQVGCVTGTLCSADSVLSTYQTLFSVPPQRALVDAHVPLLLMDLPGLTGGSQAYTYNFQLPISSELDNWMLDSMLNRPGTVVKAQLAAALGIDAVVLGPTQTAQGADYQALGWRQVSSSPLTFVNPAPSALATEWSSGAAMLVVGSDQRSASNPYNDVFERATTGMIPFGKGWSVRGQSPYIDDYTPAELARYPDLMLLGYRYHNRARAWDLLNGYVRAGGSLYVETGWQYVDPDWDLGSPAPSVLPVGELDWAPLDQSAPVLVSGVASPSWGSMSYAGSGWGASSASAASLRPGAEPLVSVGGRVVVASWQLGKGRVVWSGMNLIAHDSGAGSPVEDQFVASTFDWLFGGGDTAAPQLNLNPTWVGSDQARLDLSESAGPTWVLFKESFAPGWSAQLTWPSSPGVTGGSRSVPLVDGEMDFMLARLDSVPPGARLLFTYGPTTGVYLAWVLSALSLAGLVAWVIRPAWFGRLAAVMALVLGVARLRVTARFRWHEDDG